MGIIYTDGFLIFYKNGILSVHIRIALKSTHNINFHDRIRPFP